MVDVQVSQQNLLEGRNIETASSNAYPAETRFGLAIGPPLPSTVSAKLELKRRNR
jgi:hypothetical protein